MKLPTASGLQRAMACSASVTLPQQETVAGDAAERGTAIHRYLEVALTHGEEAAQAEVTDEIRPYVEALDLDEFRRRVCDAIPGDEARLGNEIPVWWTPEAVGELENKGHREYDGAPDDAICGTSDIVVLHSDGRAIVGDLKTGRWDPPPPHRNAQLRFLGLVLARLYGLDAVSARIAQLSLDGLRVPKADLDTLELDLFEHELTTAYRGWLAGDTTPRPGEHCRFCPAMASCPAMAAEAQVLTPLDERSEALTPETVAHAWMVAEGLEGAIKRARKVLEQYVAEYGEVPLPDGRVLRIAEGRPSSRLVPDVVRRVLTEEYGEAVAESALDVTTNKGAVKRALIEHGIKRKGEPTLRLIQHEGGEVVTPGRPALRAVEE